jgi:four helix bundle protein
MTPRQFDHERLDVYHLTLRFVAWTDDVLSGIPKTQAVHNQLDRASTSIPLNIAEGSAKFTPADRCRFFDTARGSAVECAACLDVLVVKKLATHSGIADGKHMLFSLVSMLIGLIRANDATRFREDPAPYPSDASAPQETTHA